MKILICNKGDIKKQSNSNPDFFDNDKFFITGRESTDADWIIEQLPRRTSINV